MDSRLWPERIPYIAKSAWNSSTTTLSPIQLLAVVYALSLVLVEIGQHGPPSSWLEFENIRQVLYRSREFCLAGILFQTYILLGNSVTLYENFVLTRSDATCEALQDKSTPKYQQVDHQVLFRFIHVFRHWLPVLALWLGVGCLFDDLSMAICDVTIGAVATLLFSTFTLLLNRRLGAGDSDTRTFRFSGLFSLLCVGAIWFFQMVYGVIYCKLIPAEFAKVCWPLAFDFSNYATALTFVLLFACLRAQIVRSS